VLVVGGLGFDGDGQRAQLSGEAVHLAHAFDVVVGAFVPEALFEQPADAPADGAVGEEVFGKDGVDERHADKSGVSVVGGNPER
jgi:hypothetical protein